jgi:hypothetical protein
MIPDHVRIALRDSSSPESSPFACVPRGVPQIRDILPFIRLISRLISSFFFIYLLSILVEVLLRLLTYRGDLVLLYLVSEDRS